SRPRLLAERLRMPTDHSASTRPAVPPVASRARRTWWPAGAVLALVTAVSLGSAADSIAARRLGTNRADHLTGTRHADVLVGRGGNDVLRGGAGSDRLSGGAGND